MESELEEIGKAQDSREFVHYIVNANILPTNVSFKNTNQLPSSSEFSFVYAISN